MARIWRQRRRVFPLQACANSRSWGARPTRSALSRTCTPPRGDSFAFQYAEIHAQWGDIACALDWLESAYRLRDPGLGYLRSDVLVEPLHQEARYRGIERNLEFPG